MFRTEWSSLGLGPCFSSCFSDCHVGPWLCLEVGLYTKTETDAEGSQHVSGRQGHPHPSHPAFISHPDSSRRVPQTCHHLSSAIRGWRDGECTISYSVYYQMYINAQTGNCSQNVGILANSLPTSDYTLRSHFLFSIGLPVCFKV